jgi:hypothetical protein
MSRTNAEFQILSTSLFKKPYASFVEIVPSNIDRDNCVLKIGDIWIVEAIRIPIKYDLKLFKNFEIYIYNLQIISIPFYLLSKLSCVKQTTTHNIIYISKDMFSNISTFNGFPLYLLFHSINYKITSTYSDAYWDIRDCAIIQKYTIIHSDVKRELEKLHNNKEIKSNINQYSSREFTNAESVNLYNSGYVSGYFIKTNKKLNLIKLTVGNLLIFDYESDLIGFVGSIIYQYTWTMKHKKSLYKSLRCRLPNDMINIINDYVKMYEEYLYWIPLDPHIMWNKKYDNNCDDNYNRIKLGKISSCVKIEFDDFHSGNIYSMGNAILQISDGDIWLDN